uniref:Ycf80 n=1 Tax=Gracilaria hainanensis TaxID=2871843 RepID=A0AAU7YP15_9FLOR
MYHINTHLYSSLFAKNVFLSSYDSNVSPMSKSLLSRPFIGKLINQYWQEKIFLSVSSLYSEKYMNQLKLEGILIHKNEQKKFLLDFSRALLSGRIKASLNFERINSNNNQYISYIWKKGFNFPLKLKWILSLSDRNAISLTKDELLFANRLQNQPLPLFTITNTLNQIILADSSEDNTGNLNSIDKIYKWYSDKIVPNPKSLPLYYGLFFMNPTDAIEYADYINSKYNTSNQINQLTLFSSHLFTYYKLNRMNIKNLQFRLIPDLKEISRLLYKYRYHRNLKFHKNQKYSKNFFQGQPIYMIDPFFAYNRKTNKTQLLNYYYNHKSNINNNIIEYKAIFTNYTTLLKAWHEFKRIHIDYKIPSKPKVLVYNLEDFIRTYEYNHEIKERNILFIPSQKSYEFIKNYRFVKNQNKIKRIFSNKLLVFKILSQRIIWSLTSRQPIHW